MKQMSLFLGEFAHADAENAPVWPDLQHPLKNTHTLNSSIFNHFIIFNLWFYFPPVWAGLSDCCFRHSVLGCHHLWMKSVKSPSTMQLNCQIKGPLDWLHVGNKFKNVSWNISVEKRRIIILLSECCWRQFTLNNDTLPEDSANMYPSEEYEIWEDEHGSGESREKGNATPFHCLREILLLGNQ